MGALLLILFGLLAILAPVLAPYPPYQMDTPLLPPGPVHPLGTNDIGQDILSELLYGARFSLVLAFVSAGLSTAAGTLLGVVAGHYRRLGFTLMRVVDLFLAIPRFPLIIFMAAFLKPGLGTLVLFFLLFGWARTARLVRSQVLGASNSEYVEAAQAVGATDWRIVRRHLLPGTLPVALVRFIVEFQHVILAESGLSFLGLGDPTVKSWGTILHHAFEYPAIFISDVWLWWALPPGLCITLVVLALTLLGLVLEEQANPHLRRRAGPGRAAYTERERAGRASSS
jgi:ABC-type dipeptide/oligopeptide/nickel transport system permease subunit